MLLPVILGLSLAPTAAQAAIPGTFYLDSYSSGKTGSSGPTVTDALASGQYFVAKVSGTYGPYGPKLWQPPFATCGKTDPDALIPSPGRPQSRVSQDAEWIYGRPDRSPGNCKPLPGRAQYLQISTTGVGGIFSHRTPIGGLTAAPRDDHTYSFLLAGTGAPAALRLRDTNTMDNYGVLQIDLRLATPADCGNDAACTTATQGNPPPPDQQPAQQQQGFAAPNGGPGASGGLLGASQKACVSRRSRRITVRYFRKDPVIRATIRFRGKHLKVTKRRDKKHRNRIRLSTLLNFKGLPKGAYTVDIVARTKKGKIRRGTRTYNLCVSPRPSKGPKL